MAKVALLIGVSEYEVGLNPLPAAVKDVVAFERILKDAEMGDFDEVKILTNPEPQTMRSEVETLFSGRSRDDFVLLFFSGHGIKDDNNNLYFATRITQKSAKGDLIRYTAVEARFVHEVMNNSRAKRQAIILDCCFSGAFDPNLQSKDDGSVDLQGQLGAEGRVVLTSSSSTQYSFEQQGSDLSLYTRYLIEGIETGAGDRDEDGKISVWELHEYATSKVQETAPNMTPKLITLKDLGFDLVLAKAKVTDPKLRYRKVASKFANAGTIRPAGRAVLNTLRQQLGLTIEVATVIENEVLRPYQERLANLQQYRETLIASAEHEYPLNQLDLEDLNTLQKMLGLEDKDVLTIQQEIEVQFFSQPEAYQKNLAQYGLAITETIQKGFPFSQQDLQKLEGLRQSLGLRDEDITTIERPLIQQAESQYQENLRQKSELKRQEQEKVEYANKLQCYEQEFIKAIQAEYPLNQFVIDGLSNFQIQLGLENEDVIRVEKPFRETAEVKYQEKLREQEQANQQRVKGLEEQRKAEQVKKSKQEVALKQQQQVRQDAITHYNLGIDLKAQGKVEKAITAYRKAIQLDPNFALAHNNLGTALYAQGKVEESIAAYRKAIQLDQNLAVAHSDLSVALKAQGKVEEANAASSKAIQIDPNLADNCHSSGVALYYQGKLEEAIAAYRKAIQLDPNYAYAYCNLGAALYDQGKLEEAITAFRKAIQLDPNNADYRNNLKITQKEQIKERSFWGFFKSI